MGEEEKKEDTLDREGLKNGPVMDRGCTDIICCLIFIAFIVGMVGVGGYGLTYGDPKKLTTMWNYDKQGCGYSNATIDYPYLYYPTIDYQAAKKADKNLGASVAEVLKYGVCVKECPGKDTNATVQCKVASYMLQQPKYYKNCQFYPLQVSNGNPLRYETAVFGGRVCRPSGKALEDAVVKSFKTQVWDKYVNQSGLTQYLADIMATREALAITLATAFFIGFIYLVILRFLGGPLIYATILAMIVGSAFGGWMLYQQSEVRLEGDKYKEYYLYGSYVAWGFTGLLFLCVCCNLRNIRIGVAVMKATAVFVGSSPQIFLVPPVAILVILAWLVVWMIFTLYVVSVGELGQQKPPLQMLTAVKWSDETRYAFLYSLFGYLWMNAFIIGVTQFIISACAALWYFSCTSDSNGSGSITRGFYWVFRYHLGSIAFGSFLIALIQFIRIIFEYYADQIQKANQDNPAVKALLCATRYLLDCLERFIKFISKNGYIQMAITGKNFCASAWNAFCLILKNALTFGTAASIGGIFNILGVSFIAGFNGMIVYILLHYVDAYKGKASNWIAPVVVGGIQGFVIGIMFMSVYSFASDTILQSFMVDEELNRPDGMRPAIMNDFIEGATDAANKKDDKAE